MILTSRKSTWVLVGVFLLFFSKASSLDGQKKNVILILIDDLRPELGCYVKGDDVNSSQLFPNIQTPNIDYIASKSFVAREAFVQQALCSPSRASILTGRRPDTTRVYGIAQSFRDEGGDFVTLPQYFKQNGYKTSGMGKVFHGSPSDPHDEISWTEPFFKPEFRKHWSKKDKSWRAVSPEEHRHKRLPDEDVGIQAREEIERLGRSYKIGGDPFFMAVGFLKPHLPFIFPEKFLSQYPLEDIALPSNPYVPSRYPSISWSKWRELRLFEDINALGLGGEMNETLPDNVTLDLRRAYYASVSFVDEQIGRIISTLKFNGLDNDTVVALVGDHGFFLGEHSAWAKHSNFDLATRAPFMVSIPGLTDERINSKKLVEFVDLYPTLVEAAGLPTLDLCPQDSSNVVACYEGTSLLPLIQEPERRWKEAAFSQFPRRRDDDPLKIMGYSVRTKRFRYTEWVAFNSTTLQPDWEDTEGVELYDHRDDPEENINRYKDAEYKVERKKLRKRLRRGWRKELAKVVR